MDEIEEEAIAAFWVWVCMGMFQTYAHPDIRDNLDRERAFVVYMMERRGTPIEEAYYDECLNMDVETAKLLLEYVPSNIRAIVPEIGQRWHS